MIYLKSDLFLTFFTHSIAHTELVNDIAVIAGFDSQFFAQVCHVYLQFFYTAVVARTPYLADNGGIGKYFAGLFCQKNKNVIFGLGQLDFFSCDGNQAAVIIDDQVV